MVSPLSCPTFTQDSQLVRERRHRPPRTHGLISTHTPLPISNPVCGGSQMESQLIMQPIRFKQGEGVPWRKSPNNCDRGVGDYGAHNCLDRKKLISQTFLQIRSPLFPNSQLHQESNSLTPQGGPLCALICPEPEPLGSRSGAPGRAGAGASRVGRGTHPSPARSGVACLGSTRSLAAGVPPYDISKTNISQHL